MDLQVEFKESKLQRTTVRIQKKTVNVYLYIPPAKEGDTIISKNYSYKVGKNDTETRLNKYQAQEEVAKTMARIALQVQQSELVKSVVRSMGLDAVETSDDDEPTPEPPHKKRMAELEKAMEKL